MPLTARQITQLNNMNAAAQRAQLGTILGELYGISSTSPSVSASTSPSKSPSLSASKSPSLSASVSPSVSPS